MPLLNCSDQQRAPRITSALKEMGLLLVFLPMLSGMTIQQVQAQSITSAGDRTGTIVNLSGNRFDITGGTLAGGNLFHSFNKFGLDQNQSANFISNPSIQNILGRVTGGNASIINGLIQVTGGNSHLFLINPAGIVFGSSAKLNVPADFTATTATGIGFGNSWFNAVGDNNYAALVGIPSAFAFSNNTQVIQSGSIVNSGQLSVGLRHNLNLFGGTVVNTGQLSAPEGEITVAAIPSASGRGVPILHLSQPGHLLSLDIQDSRQLQTQGFQPLPQNFSVLSLPQLLTGGGSASEATGITVNSANQVVLTGSGVAIPSDAGTNIIAGNLTVAGQTGGKVQLLGDKVGLVAAHLDASGTNGGGTVLVGGDYQGKGSVPNASQSYVSSDSTIHADSHLTGDGGKVIVWADKTTQFYGSISARSGSQSGNGGFVEVSGKENLTFNGLVDLSALNGRLGTLLLDPNNISVVPGNSAPQDTILFNQQGNIPASLEPNTDYTISEGALSQIQGDVNLAANGNITFTEFRRSPGITFKGAVSLSAGGNVFIFAPTYSFITPGKDVTISAGGSVNTSGLTIKSQGGAITLTANEGVIFATSIDSSSTSSKGGNITLTAHTNKTDVSNAAISVPEINASGLSGGGNISIRTNGPINNSRESRTIISKATSTGNGGNITLSSPTIGSANGVDSSAPNGVAGDITIENPNPGGTVSSIGTITATGKNDGGGNLIIVSDNPKLRFDSQPVLQPDGTIKLVPYSFINISGSLGFTPVTPGLDIYVAGDNDIPGALNLSQLFINSLSNSNTNIRGGILIGGATAGTIHLLNPFSFNSPVNILGGKSLVSPNNADTTFTFTGPQTNPKGIAYTGTVSGFNSPSAPLLTFNNITNVVGGNNANNTFKINNGVSNVNVSINGGTGGSNTLDFSDFSQTNPVAVNLNLAQGTATYRNTNTPILSSSVTNIQNIIGGAGDDLLRGKDGVNGTFTGGPGNNTIIGGGLGAINTVKESANADFSLTDTSVNFNPVGIDSLTNIQAANLTGTGGGHNFSISNWTGNATVNGLQGSAYTIALNGNIGTTTVNDSATTNGDILTVNGTTANNQFVIAGTQLKRGNETVNFTPNVSLTVNGGLGNDSFNVSNWAGNANLNGAAGSNNYTVVFSGTSSGTTTINDSRATGTNTVTVKGTTGDDQFGITSNQVKRSNETVNFGSQDSLTVDGNGGNNTYTIGLNGGASNPTTITDSNKNGTDTLIANSAAISNPLVLTKNQIALNNQLLNYQNTDNLTVNAGSNSQAIQVRSPITLPGNISLNAGSDITSNSDITANGGITLTSTNGSIDTSAGTLNSSSTTGNGGSIALTSSTGTVTTGNATSQGATSGGAVTVIAGNRIKTGTIDSSSSGGNGGNVILDPQNGVQVVSINAQGGTQGKGGNVTITTQGLFQATGTFIDQTGRQSSISTAGGTGSGSITIQHGGGASGIPFTVGNSSQNGTAGAITTSATNSITPFQSFPGPYTQGNIQLITQTPPPVTQTPPSPPITQPTPEVVIPLNLDPEILKKAPASDLKIATNVPAFVAIETVGLGCNRIDLALYTVKDNQDWLNFVSCLSQPQKTVSGSRKSETPNSRTPILPKP